VNGEPIIEEIWEVKDRLVEEAGGDANRFIANLRRWEAEHGGFSRALPGTEPAERP
jgi:hypothetical protein